MGFIAPAENNMLDTLGLERDARNNIKVGINHQTSSDGIYAAGDMDRRLWSFMDT